MQVCKLNQIVSGVPADTTGIGEEEGNGLSWFISYCEGVMHLGKGIWTFTLCAVILMFVSVTGAQVPAVSQMADTPFDSFHPGVSGDFALLYGRKLSYFDSTGKLIWEREFNKKVKDVLVLEDTSVAAIYDYHLMLISSNGGTERVAAVNDEAVMLFRAPDDVIIAGHAYGAQAFYVETLSTMWDYYPHDECDY